MFQSPSESEFTYPACQANGVYQSLIYKSAGLVQTPLQPQIEPILQNARKVSEDSNPD